MTLADPKTPWFSVKEAVLPFARFPGVDTLLGPEMRSTGEVMGWDRTFALRLPQGPDGRRARSCPTRAACSSSIKDMDKTPDMAAAMQALAGMGFTMIATRGTAAFLTANGVAAEVVNKVYEGRPNIVDQMKDGRIALVMNTTEGSQAVSRQPRDPGGRALRQDPVFHDGGGERGGGAGDAGAGGGVRGEDVAGVRVWKTAMRPVASALRTCAVGSAAELQWFTISGGRLNSVSVVFCSPRED